MLSTLFVEACPARHLVVEATKNDRISIPGSLEILRSSHFHYAYIYILHKLYLSIKGSCK